MKISILLPFKENYSNKFAGAVSLFVKDTTMTSSFRKQITVFGSTAGSNFLTKNYVNLTPSRSLIKSSNKEYVKEFLKHKKFNSTEILEIHNRPNYVKFIRPSYSQKIFLYFHNDPLSMTGSETLNDREYLINNVEKLIFNSTWSKNRFFIGFNNKKKFENKTSICFQSTNKVSINFKKKEKIISFIGKLNSAKGYDIFGQAILKILDKYPNWKAYVIGDEPREKLNYEHPNLIKFGFKDNTFILNVLKKISISVITSRWEEPFGRASLEAASRGSAVIISKKGGLPETSRSAIILDQLNHKKLYSKIDSLIKNKKLLQETQKLNYKNFFLTHKYVTNIIDNIRKQFSKKLINIHLNKTIKIIHITNFNYRFDGRLQYNTGRRINNGLVRLGHNILTISDRDIINQNRNIIDPTGKGKLQKKIINSYFNFKPDLIILGHADNVTEESLNFLKNKNVKIAQWFLDPISKDGPDYINNKKRILDKEKLIDANFLTTDPNSLDFKIKKSYFIPNPCDQSFEVLKNYENKCDYDLFFAMSHGVHRGELKKGKIDKREFFLNRLIKKNKNIKFDIYGMNNIQPIWGDLFIEKISNCSMGLNLSRGKPVKYYSSDRLAQLMGNGLLTFIDEKTKYNDFFSNKEAVMYKNINDLSEKLNEYKMNAKERSKIAKNGRDFYFKYFNSTIIANYIIEKTFDFKSSNKFIWEK